MHVLAMCAYNSHDDAEYESMKKGENNNMLPDLTLDG